MTVTGIKDGRFAAATVYPRAAVGKSDVSPGASRFITRPKALKPGDTVGIAAPAGPVGRVALESGIRVLASMGFNIVLPDGLFSKHHYLAGDDHHRAAQLIRLFTDPAIDGIVCARGGYGTLRLLPLLDPAVLSAHPTSFVGFSDITALLCFLTDRCAMAAFHGPTVTTLGMGSADTKDRFFRVLTEKTPPERVAAACRTLVPGKASGRFYCGNLTLFCHLTGTPFQPDLRGAILLVEDRNEAPYRIDRLLTQMRLAGCFEGLAGLALGCFSQCGSEDEIAGIVLDRLGDLGFPICAGFGVGHEPDNATVPVGIAAHLDADAGTLVFTEPALC